MRQWLLITEDELYAWSQCYSWRLPQKPIPIDCKPQQVLSALGKRCLSLSENDKDSLVIAEFDCVVKGKATPNVPFYQIDCIYGISAQRAEILNDRYAEFGLKTEQLDELRADLCRKAIKACCDSIELSDIRIGAKAMLEMLQIAQPNDYKKLVSKAEKTIKGGGDTLLSLVFDYSRAEPWKCEGLLAALCDLGKILRQLLKGADVDTLEVLSARVAEALRRGDVSCYASISQLLTGLGPSTVFDPALVLFLSWKYATERNNGRIDIECISHDVLDIGNDESVGRALCMFGAFCGFAAMADIYHQMMRGKCL